MKHLITACALMIAATSLAACGFAPVHSSTLGAGYSSSNVTIPEIPGRAGHELRKALVEEFAAGLPGIENATLTVSLKERLGRLAIRPDEAAARTDLTVTGRYVLDTGEDAITGEAGADTSYNVPLSAFGDIAAQTAATEQVMSLLAQRIADDLKLQLRDTPRLEDIEKSKDIELLNEFEAPESVETLEGSQK